MINLSVKTIIKHVFLQYITYLSQGVVLTVIIWYKNVVVCTSPYIVYNRCPSVPQALEFRTPFFLIWSLPRLWYGSLSGGISLNHLSIFYNISCCNSRSTNFGSRSSCRFSYIYHRRSWHGPPPFF